MSSIDSSNQIIQGITLAVLVCVIASGAVPVMLGSVKAASSPLFSVTLVAPTGSNAIRRQYAADITKDMVALGIDAKLQIVDFSSLTSRLFFQKVSQGAIYQAGGYDIGFIGWGFTSPVPDFRGNFDGRTAYFAPTGSNYALYNSPEVNAIFDQLYGAGLDAQTRLSLVHKLQEMVFHDAPYNYVYEGVNVVPRNQKWSAWGSPNVYSQITFPDVQHWSGGNILSFGEAGNVFPGTLDPAVTASSNTFYALYIYGAIMGGGLQETDARTLQPIPGTAESITSSPDGLDWSVNLKPGVLFQDGVEVTADDFVYTQYALTNPQLSSINLATNIQVVGSRVDFTFSDGTKLTDTNPSGSSTTSNGWWKVTGKYSFQFHLPAPYPFTSQVYCAFAPLPKHIMEKFAFSTWDGAPFSTAKAPYTYNWNASRYGGSGSYTAVGPVGAGPYILQNYDFANGVATMKKFPQYWNASGLEALGQFSVDTYKVSSINSADAAIAALKAGTVDILDSNYGLGSSQAATLRQLGFNVLVAPGLGWQEQGFNLKHPVFGTGVNTPLGKSNPSQAAEAARHVRKAISHLINRNHIVNDLLGGLGYPLASFAGPGWGAVQDSTLQPDTYDLGAAADELRAAGYVPTITASASVTSTIIATTSQSASTQSSTTLTTTTSQTSIQSSSTTAVQTAMSSTGIPTALLAGAIIVVVFIVIAAVFLLRRKKSK